MFEKMGQLKAMQLIKASEQGVTRTEIIKHCGNNITRSDLDTVLAKLDDIGVLQVVLMGERHDLSAIGFKPTTKVRGMRYVLRKPQDNRE